MNLSERNALRRRHVQLSMSLPLTLIEVVDRYAESVGLDTSAAITDLIRDGLRLKAATIEHNAKVAALDTPQPVR